EEIALKLSKMFLDLKKEMPYLVEIKFIYQLEPTSTRELVLDTTFESLEELEAYQVHPSHKAIASYLQTVVGERVCFDYFL
ncbi:MAG: Dabb family protein, partial [Lachnospiraceae bacterium]